MTTFPAPELRWAVCPQPDDEEVSALAATLSVPSPLAALLVQRGHSPAELARRFLKQSLAELSGTLSIFDLAAAARLVAEAVTASRTIIVHGDYDVDGQC